MFQSKVIVKSQKIGKEKFFLFNSFLSSKLRKFNPYKIVVFTGLIFLAGSIVDLYYEFSFKKALLMVRQVTGQANLFALILASLHLGRPNLLILRFNYLFIATASLLITASIIFFFFLCPIFLNLNLLHQSLLTPASSLIFGNIGNHVVTPLSFFNLLVHRMSNQNFRGKISRTTSGLKYKFYGAINLLGNVYFSFDATQPSAYGAASNGYGGKRTVYPEENGDLRNPLIISYNFQLAFFAFFIVMFVTSFAFFFLGYLFGSKPDKISKFNLKPSEFLTNY